VISVKACDFQGFKLFRVQWCRRLLCAIYSSLYGFMLGACVFRVSSFLGFIGAADCCQKFSMFWVVSCQGFVFLGIQLSRVQCCRVFLWAIHCFLCGFMLGACVFWVSSFLGLSGAADCCEKTCSFSPVVFMGFSCMLFCTFLLRSLDMCNSLISVCSTELVVQFLLKDET